ncbi:hypothetical protein OOK13_40910 [Streptomyces sp. NBC_00378]|uniref:hypothetical protein n=1 Tax=unclassified Streptomyces TaxID=2593676 RepID=UPI002255EEDF|nr:MULTISPECIES: hypothetical protein [unclassified Streptomyces]MCX5114718.1 hypothetical protein [Streptomyces sp. NBC_00378]
MHSTHKRKNRALALAAVAVGLLAGGIAAGGVSTTAESTDTATDTIANAAAAEPGKLPAVKGLKFTLGDRSVKLDWKKVAGADDYRVYADYSCDTVPNSASSSQLVKDHLGKTTEWTHQNIKATCVNYAVAAMRDGQQGVLPPFGKRVLVSMPNRDHSAAAQRFFTAAPSSGDRVATTRVAPGKDRGIVLARAYIRNKTLFTDAIGDHRSWTANPAASAKITVAWNTSTGEVAAYAHKSCPVGITAPAGSVETPPCRDALPLAFVSDAASVGDTSKDPRNLISVSRTSSRGLSIGVSAMNSWERTCVGETCVGPGFGRINARLTLSPGKDTFTASLTADKFPAWEFLRYPHFVQGAPETRIIGFRDQTEIGDLRSGQQSTCTSKGPETLQFTNPMSC